jgi:hypothetical protein
MVSRINLVSERSEYICHALRASLRGMADATSMIDLWERGTGGLRTIVENDFGAPQASCVYATLLWLSMGRAKQKAGRVRRSHLSFRVY